MVMLHGIDRPQYDIDHRSLVVALVWSLEAPPPRKWPWGELLPEKAYSAAILFTPRRTWAVRLGFSVGGCSV